MKLYDAMLAPNPRRVRIFLAEKGISVPTEQVDIGAATNRQPAFRAKNPMGTVPVLELDDGTCIAESVAICRYFEETQPEPPLMGVDALDRAQVRRIVERASRESTCKASHCLCIDADGCMSTSVRSTVIIDDDLFRRAKEQAARQNTTLSAVVNQALRQALDRPSAEAPVFHMVTFGDPGVRVDHEPAEFAAALEQDDFRCPRG